MDTGTTSLTSNPGGRRFQDWFNGIKNPHCAPQFFFTTLRPVTVILLFVASSSQNGCCSSRHHNLPPSFVAGNGMTGSFFFLRLFLPKELLSERLLSLAVLLLQLIGWNQSWGNRSGWSQLGNEGRRGRSWLGMAVG